ncbi:MAG TPA: hypothetical protein VHL11_23100 [Phototrophicaceae bacterium]|nr:hypothetical protein [Phototrophicaceae bacterium]
MPTLPPEWTKTFTPTFTITPTLTSTPTATALIPEANVCASFTFELEDLSPDILVSNDVGINFAAGVEQRDAIVTILTSNRTNPGGTAPDRSDIFGGQLYLVNFGEGIASGVYDWTASVSTSYYTDICKKNGTVTVVAPATPEPTTRPSLADELLGVIIRRIREDVFAPMQTQTQAGLLTATPAAP